MKTKFLSFLTITATALGLASCADSWEPLASDTGEVALKTLGVEVKLDESVISRAGIDLNPYIVTVYNDQNGSVSQWRFADMPEIFSLPVGNYSVEVKSHQVEKAAWDAPLYLGTKEFKVEKDRITEIGTVVCSFASLKVTVNFGEDLLAVCSDMQVRVVANDEGELTFTPDEQRAGYFEVITGSTTIAAHFTGTVNGYVENIVSTYTDIEAGQHYILNYRLRTNPLEPDPETGQIDPSQGIFVETGVTEVNQDGTVNNDEDLIDTDPDHNHEQFVEEVDMKYDAAAQTIAIAAPAGLASVTVSVAPDENAEFAAAFAALNNANLAGIDLSQFGLPTPSQIEGATSLTINLTTLVNEAQEYEGIHSFTFSAADKKGAQGEPVTVKVTGKSAVEPITFESALRFGVELDPSLESDGKVIISAPAGISSLVVSINSDNSDFADVTSTISGQDFAHPDEALVPTLNAFGLANGSEVLNQTSVVFDITSFLSEAFLPSFPGRHQFDIKVTDNDTNEKSITLIFVVK